MFAYFLNCIIQCYVNAKGTSLSTFSISMHSWSLLSQHPNTEFRAHLAVTCGKKKTLYGRAYANDEASTFVQVCGKSITHVHIW